MSCARCATPAKCDAWIDPALLAKSRMTPEEEDTVRRGCCPRCMERTLGEPVEAGGIRCRQCTRCGSIYVGGVSLDAEKPK